MAILSWRNQVALLSLVLAAVAVDTTVAFLTPSPPRGGLATRKLATFGRSLAPPGSVISKARPQSTTLRMAADDFNESKYTEAAWSLIASLTKAADFYQASSIEAPILLDVMMNPMKHNAGEEAESARRVAEKVFGNSGVDVKLMRQELDRYLSSQARLSESSSKTMGQILQKVLDNARVSRDILGVS